MKEVAFILLVAQLATWIILARFWKSTVDDQVNKIVKVGLHLNILFTLFIMLVFFFESYI